MASVPLEWLSTMGIPASEPSDTEGLKGISISFFIFLSILILLLAFFPIILKNSLAGISSLLGAGLLTDIFLLLSIVNIHLK